MYVFLIYKDTKDGLTLRIRNLNLGVYKCITDKNSHHKKMEM